MPDDNPHAQRDPSINFKYTWTSSEADGVTFQGKEREGNQDPKAKGEFIDVW